MLAQCSGNKHTCVCGAGRKRIEAVEANLQTQAVLQYVANNIEKVVAGLADFVQDSNPLPVQAPKRARNSASAGTGEDDTRGVVERALFQDRDVGTPVKVMRAR